MSHAPPKKGKTKMAASEDVDYDFVNVPPANLTCPICMKVLCKPHMVNCCNQEYCQKCLKQWKRGNETCPQCRSTGYAHMHMKQTSRKVGELKVYCPNTKRGCQAIVEISEYKTHLEQCQYVEIKCSYLCESIVFRCQMANHVANHCVRRPVECTHCKHQGEYQDITGNHMKSCPSFPLPCPQKCGTTVLRKDLASHQEECPLETAPCPFSELGCKVKVYRKDLEKHVESSALQHMTVLAKSHISLKAENEMLKKRLSAVGTELQSMLPSIKCGGNVYEVAARVYPLLMDTSIVTRGTTQLTLGLSGASEKAGHHYLELCERYKFKLEWESINKKQPSQPTFLQAQQLQYRESTLLWHANQLGYSQPPCPKKMLLSNQDSMPSNVYRLKLFIVVNEDHLALPNSWDCEVQIKITPGQRFVTLAVIRKGKPEYSGAHTASSDGSLKLLGSTDYSISHAYGSQPFLKCLEISFKAKEKAN